MRPYDGQRPRGKFGQDAGVTPLLLLGFLITDIMFIMTTESRFYVSSEG